jgi:hypothetical protein
MRRVEEGEERWKAAVLQDTMSIAVAELMFWYRASWVGGRKLKVAPFGNPFSWKMLALFCARKCASSILLGGKRYEAKKNPKTHRTRSVCVFLILKKTENPVWPTFS